MSSHSVLVFSLLLVSSIIFVSNFGTSFADEVIGTSTGFEDSTILELKNSRGNTANIDTVRIWLSGDNEFKSFKTEEGWIGKNTPQGVIIFTSQNEINPGQSVKFGIKTTENNPVVNWKAVDSSGEVISSASTTVTSSEISQNKPELNQPKIVTIKESSSFRFIPERPASNSDFRVVGEQFVPNQSLDFYISNELHKSVKVDENGRILFTANLPVIMNDERTEFVLRDSGGNEKNLSIRIPQLENREIPDVIKLSLGNTPQDIKRGDILTLEGMATPNTTVTITLKDVNGDILGIDTIQVGFDGKWTYDNLFSPNLDLGIVSIEIEDGKTKALRNINVISAKLINISSTETSIDAGNTIMFEGIVIPEQEMSVIIEDAIGTEIFSRTVSVGETGIVNFNVEIPRGSVEGTYILSAFQGNESGISTFGVGQEPEPILIVRPTKLNFSASEIINIEIQGSANAQVSIILIDSADREKISDTLNLGPDGKEIYKINSTDLPTGAYTLNAKRGESSGSAVFTLGLTTGSGAISIQTTRDEYKQGEQILILGNTGAINVLLDVTITDSEGKVIKKIETFSDRFGVFKIDNFRIPLDAKLGTWTVNAKSGGNFKDTVFSVSGENKELVILVDKTNYDKNELMNISGSGARLSATVTIKILDSEGIEISELNITAKSNGNYLTIWQIPADIESGDYEMTADDGASNTSTKFTIN
ncbi:hypothetical protein OAK66_01780 [Candidatus Nitrosopelagicus sp.]|nr:hypothetical protein [Candidatus Nitrosopelagicus sp.]MDC0241149.1 hypothetical protein [Candidatus Nitrosopelagicus sp.]